ncbi:MAG: hypothetical protein IJD81_05970 [Oscillospiraceae bacterium]|nr:hypothetical protein [Oscillospiraceae bacterium]
MKIMFKYLDREIDIDLTEFQDGKEPVTIIPHDVLHDLIYNSEEAAQNNIQVHSVLSFSEPGHYAYQCVINDKNGRRIEGFGESTAATLTTEIARNYPALMANKRAFDDAAIKFLGCEGKVYSDQQIDISGQQLSSAASCDDYSADAANEESGDISGDISDDISEDTNGNSAGPENTSGDISGDISDDISSADDAQEPAPKTAAKQNSAAKSTGKKAPEPAADEDDPDLDEFDTTIIVCGSLKREGLSVRAAYEKKPDAIEWIAKNLPGKNDTFKAQKEICQRFLEHVQNGGC